MSPALRRPIRQVGARKLRWAAWQERNRTALAARCKGRCDGCGATGMRMEAHHCAGRVAEPFASHVACLAALCGPCHRKVTGVVGGMDVELRDRMAWLAAQRLSAAFELPLPAEVPISDGIHLLDRLIEDAALLWDFDPEAMRFRRVE